MKKGLKKKIGSAGEDDTLDRGEGRVPGEGGRCEAADRDVFGGRNAAGSATDEFVEWYDLEGVDEGVSHMLPEEHNSWLCRNI